MTKKLFPSSCDYCLGRREPPLHVMPLSRQSVTNNRLTCGWNSWLPTQDKCKGPSQPQSSLQGWLSSLLQLHHSSASSSAPAHCCNSQPVPNTISRGKTMKLLFNIGEWPTGVRWSRWRTGQVIETEHCVGRSFKK